MPEQKLDLIIDVETMNAAQIESVQKAMAELGISTDQLSDRMKTAMQVGQAHSAALDEEAKSAGRTAEAAAKLSAGHEEVARSATAVTHGMSDLQNVLTNAAVNATMGGNAFSNLAWGLMFSPTSSAMALTGFTSVAYAGIEALVAMQQETAQLSDRALALAVANHVSIEEGAAWAPVLDALGIKTNDLAKAEQEAIDKTGSLAAVQALEGEAAARGAVVTDQQVQAMLRQQDAAEKLSLEWAALSNRLGAGVEIQTRAEDALSQFLRGDFDVWGAFVTMVRGSADAHDAASIAARNHAAQEAALEKQESAALKAMDGATQAALHQREADLSLHQALSILNSATAESTADQRKVEEATNRVKLAQDAYNKAVKDYGPVSDQALKAQTSLMTAQDGLTKAQDAGSAMALQQAQAELQAERAVVDLSIAAVDAAEKQAELAGAHLTTAQKAQEMIDALLAEEATLAPGGPLRAFIDQYIAQLESIPTRINTVIQTTQVVTVNPNVGNPQSGLTSAEGGVFTQPTLTWVGEAGPEAIVPLQPGNTAPGASPLPSGGGFGTDPHAMFLLQRMARSLEAIEDAARRPPASFSSLLTGV